jgi:hypothetical protein
MWVCPHIECTHTLCRVQFMVFVILSFTSTLLLYHFSQCNSRYVIALCMYVVWRCTNCTSVLCTTWSSTTRWMVLRAIRRIYAIYNTEWFFGTNTSAHCTFSRGMRSYEVTVLPFVELTCEFLREALRTQLAIFQTPLAVKPCSTLNVSFFGSVAPLPPLPTIQTLLSLFVSCCFVWIRSLIESINTRDESVIEFSAAALMPILFSTYGAHGAVKDHCFLAYSTPVLLLIYPPP